MKIIKFCLLFFCLTSLIGCKQITVQNIFKDNLPLNIVGDRPNSKIKLVSFGDAGGKIAETATPKIIQELNRQLEQYSPQVEIVAPSENQLFEQTDVNVQLKVRDLPIFQDSESKLGNHLNLILDNEPAQAIYTLEQPIVLKQLTPGTHSLRVFAARPWGESYKNSGAYVQTTFSVLTETNDNRPDPNLPLLTYSNPTGIYGAEPILLDFYLTNAPLHSVAQNDPHTKDWSIKTTVNGESFLLKNWQPVYLAGLNSGENWIQLELLDKSGKNIENVFNNTVRVIQYEPGKENTLARLVSNRVSLGEAQSMIERNSETKDSEDSEIKNSQIKAVNLPANTDVDQSKAAVKSEQLSDDYGSLKTVESPNEISTDLGLEQTILPNEIIDNKTDPEIENNEVLSTDPNDPVDFKKINEPTRGLSEVGTVNVKDATQSLVNQSSPQPLIKQEQTVEVGGSQADLDTLTETEVPQETASIDESNDESKLVKDELDESREFGELYAENKISEQIKTIEKPILSSLPKEAELPEITGSKTQSSPPWLKKLLVGLRQRLEALARLLPSN